MSSRISAGQRSCLPTRTGGGSWPRLAQDLTVWAVTRAARQMSLTVTEGRTGEAASIVACIPVAPGACAAAHAGYRRGLGERVHSPCSRVLVIGLEKENTIGTEMENVRAEAEGFTCPSWAF